MEEMIEEPIKVYIKINKNNEITEVGSSIFIQNLTGWIEIDRGFGDKYAHSQSHYFDKDLFDDNGNYNYKYENGKIKNLV